MHTIVTGILSVLFSEEIISDFTVVGNSQRTPKCIFCIYIIEYNFNNEQLNGLEIIKSI